MGCQSIRNHARARYEYRTFLYTLCRGTRRQNNVASVGDQVSVKEGSIRNKMQNNARHLPGWTMHPGTTPHGEQVHTDGEKGDDNINIGLCAAYNIIANTIIFLKIYVGNNRNCNFVFDTLF